MSRLLGWFALGRPRELGLAVAGRHWLEAVAKGNAASFSNLAGRSMLAARGENASRIPSVGSLTLVQDLYRVLGVKEQVGATAASRLRAAVQRAPESSFASLRWADLGDG